jgi:hypothetical protein
MRMKVCFILIYSSNLFSFNSVFSLRAIKYNMHECYKIFLNLEAVQKFQSTTSVAYMPDTKFNRREH